ncbi:hypothetical protein [Nissabacter sp. SGAir0207]|nr:hypothetical protein [Nissabacter sp. SGAir0207]
MESQSTMHLQRRLSGSETTLRLRAMTDSGHRGLHLHLEGCCSAVDLQRI